MCSRLLAVLPAVREAVDLRQLRHKTAIAQGQPTSLRMSMYAWATHGAHIVQSCMSSSGITATV